MNYDEPLTENPFFQHIHNHFPDILDRVIEESWIICVPRFGTIQASALIADDIFDHILIPTGSAFRTLSKKSAVIHEKMLSLEEEKHNVQILFSETFYVGRGKKYKVVCIEQPLNRESCLKPQNFRVENLQDCLQLLLDEDIKIREITRLIAHSNIHDSTFQTATLQVQRELVSSLYDKCLDLACRVDRGLSEEAKFALETYLQHSIHHNLFPAICNCTSQTDSHFNKIVRNIEVASSDEVSTCAKIELNGINHWTTVFGKLECLRGVLKSSGFVTTDDLLHTFVSFILKTTVVNWIANLNYITQFRFSSLSLSDENSFLITTLEAAIEYIKSGCISSARFLPFSTSDPNLKALFGNIIAGDLELVDTCLRPLNKIVDRKLCHPLCSCDACKQVSLATSACTINGNDENGYTPLHIACLYGKAHIIEYLLSKGSNPNVVDLSGATPLHYAALQGHQNALLLLLHSDAYVRIPDFNGNTVLHLAVNNGHESCVKALLYFLEQKGDYLDIDSRNNFGNTPLHLASKWGYMSIVKILLQYGANAGAANRHNQTPLHIAHSCYIADLLRTTKTEIVHSFSVGTARQNNNNFSNVNTPTINWNVFGVRSKNVEQEKRVELLLKAIENDDLPLTCYYVGIPGPTTAKNPLTLTSCHPLCNCNKCTWQFSEQEVAKPPPLEASEILHINACNEKGYTSLHIAAEHGRIDILRILLDRGAEVNACLFTSYCTPLHLACKRAKIAVVRELLKCGGCNPDAKDVDANTPLHLACHCSDVRIVEVLLSHGVDINVKNLAGKTALQSAKDSMLGDIVKLFKS